MKTILTSIFFFSTSVFLFAQDFDFELGESRQTISSEQKKLGAQLTNGMSKEGLVFLMDESSDGMRAWYFDDNNICTALYIKFNTQKGRDLIVGLKILAAKQMTKVDDTVYCKDDDYCYKFSVPSDRELALLVYKNNSTSP